MAGFERVLDSQRALFSQQERLVNNLGNVAQSLVTLYKAMGGGWQQARGRPLVDDATRETMAERSDWRDLLAVPSAAARCRPATDHTGEGRTMTEESPSQNPSTATGSEAPQPGKATGSARRSCWR
jgi:hypothetical protein